MVLTEGAKKVFHGVVTIDRSAIELGVALRCSVGVAIPLVIAVACGHPTAGFAPAIGALIGGFASLQGIYRSRIAIVLAVTLGVAIASFFGALAAPSVPALVIAVAIIGYCYGTISQIGALASAAALNTTVAFIIFSSISLTPHQDLEQSALLLAGGLIQAILLLIVWPIDRFTIERRALAAAYRELADFAQSLATPNPTVPPIAALTTARQIAADQLPLARARDVARFNRILGDAEALRHRFAALMTLRPDGLANVPAEFSQLVQTSATLMRALAATLDGTMSKDELEQIRLKALVAFEAFERVYAGNDFALALVRDITAHLRDATQGVAVAATGRPVRVLLSGSPRPDAYIDTRIDWLSRDAIRIAVVLGIATLMGHTLFSADRGYWIALTAAMVLRPDLHGTIVRGFARIAGTLLGAVLAALVLVASHANPAWQIIGMTAAAAVCYLTMVPNYALFSTGITIFVILALNLGFSRSGTIDARVLDTLVGGALAMIGYIALPTWVRRRTRPLLVDFIDAQRAFAVGLLDAYADPQRIDRDDLGTIRTRAWKIRTDVEASIDRARAEPHRPHTIDTDRALNILAATQSFALVSMALESGFEIMPPAPPFPALIPLRDALDRAMHGIAAALSESRPAHDGSLATVYDRLVSERLETQHPAYRFVLSHAEGYVQAVTTLAALT